MTKRRKRAGWAWWDKGATERVLAEQLGRHDQTTSALVEVLRKRLKLEGSRHTLNCKVLRWLRIIAEQGWMEQRDWTKKGPLGRPSLVWGMVKVPDALKKS